MQNDVGYQRADEVFVAARIKERHIEDQDVHFLFARQDAPLFLNLFVVAPQPVYARNAELIAGAQFFHQCPVVRAVEVLAGLLIHIQAAFRDATFRHG